jgi:hypothetical protein
LKIELQLPSTISARPAVTTPTNSQLYPFVQTSTATAIPNELETFKPALDPQLASQIYQQHQINLQPTYNPIRDPNVFDPYMSNAFLNQQFYLAPQDPYTGLRQNYGNPVSTYQQSTSGFPFFNWFGSGSNINNSPVYQEQAQPPRPVIDFITNIANDNPITSFWNTFNQNLQTNQNQYNNQRPIQAFLSAINPLNAFLTNNNNNNNNNNLNNIIKPTTSLPVTQGDYIQPIPPASNLDTSVFSNDHFLNPNSFYQNQVPSVMHNYYPNSNGNLNQYYPSQPTSYSQLQHNNRYPYYFNPYQTSAPLSIMPSSYNNRKKVGTKSKRKKNNKNKVNVPDSESDWFQGFLDKRKEASLDTVSRHSLKDSDEDDDDDFDDYFR